MAAFVEFEHTQIALRQDYFRLVLDQLSSLFGIGSAFVDLYAIYNKTHKTLNLKVWGEFLENFCVRTGKLPTFSLKNENNQSVMGLSVG